MQIYVYDGRKIISFSRMSGKRSWISDHIFLGDDTFNSFNDEIKKIFKNVKVSKTFAPKSVSAFFINLYFKSNSDEAEFMLQQKDITIDITPKLEKYSV
jgi:hypothetical protein